MKLCADVPPLPALNRVGCSQVGLRSLCWRNADHYKSRLINIQIVLGNGWCRLQNAGGKLVVLSPTPFPLKMSLSPIFRSCVSMMTEMKGERAVAFLPLDYSGLYFSAFCTVNSWGQSLHLALNVRDEQTINFRTK